jgi:hypothetical protein
LLALAASASCSSDRPTSAGDRSSDHHEQTNASASKKLTPSGKVGAPSAPSAVGPDGCTGREMHDCARTKGCLLDQPTYRAPLCRPAENPCEGAVRHADLIGPDADPAVTPAMGQAAEKECLAIPQCGVSSGRCSCACAILANCDCACGGSYLRRCTWKSELSRFDGRPASDLDKGQIGDIGRALVAVAKSPSGRAFKVDPLPAVGDLVGKNKHDIENVLGTGHTCGDTTTAPCKVVGQVFYSLYKLDKGALGGGPELLLSYDSAGKCSEAKITFTR